MARATTARRDRQENPPFFLSFSFFFIFMKTGEPENGYFPSPPSPSSPLRFVSSRFVWPGLTTLLIVMMIIIIMQQLITKTRFTMGNIISIFLPYYRTRE